MRWLSRFSAPAGCSSGELHKESSQARPCLIVAARPDPLSKCQVNAILERLPARDPFVIAADGGAKVACALGIMPHLIVGDMDSLGEDQEQFRQYGCEWVLHRAEKDETDTHLAMDLAFSRGYSDLTVVIQRTGRLDHVMSAIWVGAGFAEMGARVGYVDTGFEAAIMKGPAVLSVQSEKRITVSLLPLTILAEGITLRGMRYPLSDESLRLGESRGISNELRGQEGRIELRGGMLLVMVTDDEG